MTDVTITEISSLTSITHSAPVVSSVSISTPLFSTVSPPSVP